MSGDKRTIAGILILLTAAMAMVGSSGCIFLNVGSEEDLPPANNGSWYNYDIMDSSDISTLKHTYDAKENFYAYANAESIRQTANPNILSVLVSLMNGGSSESERIMAELTAQFDAVSKNTSLTGTEAELVRTVNTMYHDTDTRNELGVSPVLPAVAEIRNVSTLDELSALISSGGVSSLKEAFVREAASGCLDNGRCTVLDLVSQEFALTDSYVYQNMTPETAQLYTYLMHNFHTFLERCGYSSDEANATVEAFQHFEAVLAPVCDNLSSASAEDYTKYYNPCTYEDLSHMAFPIAGDLKDYYDAGVTRYSVVDPAWLNKLNELYTQDNIEEFKAAMLYNLYMTATPFLDQELQEMYFDYQIMQVYPYLLELVDEMMNEMMDTMDSLFGWLYTLLNVTNASSSAETSTMFDELDMSAEIMLPEIAAMMAETRITEEYIGMALGKTIVEANVPAGEKEKYVALIQDILVAAADRMENADWLSASTRSAAIDKLNNIKVRVLYPDDWSYYRYDDVDYRNASTFYNLSVQLRKHNQAEIIKDALQSPSETVWLKDSSHRVFILPQTYNAFYNPADNSINIPYGYVSGLIGNPDVTDEEILAVAGTAIAHEIIHGFDPTGSKFDADGSYVDWWTETDREIFTEKEQKIADYFSTFEARPGEYLEGTRMTGEAIADFGGMALVLDMARSLEDFDYDRFFTAFGRNFYQPMMNVLYGIYLSDVHPPGMYRVNVDVQQFDEFYSTYNVTEGDLMYLAPENRLSLW